MMWRLNALNISDDNDNMRIISHASLTDVENLSTELIPATQKPPFGGFCVALISCEINKPNVLTKN